MLLLNLSHVTVMKFIVFISICSAEIFVLLIISLSYDKMF